MKIISIDPGYERMGVAVLEKNKEKEALLFSDCIITKRNFSHAERLNTIGTALEKIIKEFDLFIRLYETEAARSLVSLSTIWASIRFRNVYQVLLELNGWLLCSQA